MAESPSTSPEACTVEIAARISYANRNCAINLTMFDLLRNLGIVGDRYTQFIFQFANNREIIFHTHPLKYSGSAITAIAVLLQLVNLEPDITHFLVGGCVGNHRDARCLRFQILLTYAPQVIKRHLQYARTKTLTLLRRAPVK
jgi:hypothetical protein